MANEAMLDLDAGMRFEADIDAMPPNDSDPLGFVLFCCFPVDDFGELFEADDDIARCC